MDFHDKVVMITGAAGAIGKVLSKRFHEEGAILVLIDKDKESLDALKNFLPKDVEALYFHADCANEEMVEHYVNKTVDLFGGIDAFVHCVGITGDVKPATTLDTSHLMEIYQSNVITAFLNYKYVYPVMQKQRYGSILFTSAVFGIRGLPHFAAYSTACHALLGFMKSVALEAALTGVRINALIPAPTNSPVMEEVEKALFPSDPDIGRKHILGFLPFGRYVEPEEIAETAVYMSSHRAKYINGTSHIIDGGMLAK
ncbi:SDR family oxidoreductase [Shimazuella sp. AN120528]|uniref:SDR family NAD(P)-dependent oxidoreductase n=1 Tax=Shimazuella soli TaxID=1892854 RepID=UPI001F0D7F5E|nr:SDR family oxidoreductase [Shimazuella soli]MCH5585188.1 SDR family oxidoreductase [Shimazuella soli]